MPRWLKETVLVLAILLPVGAGAQQPASSPENDLLNTMCSLCHSPHRVYNADPARLKEIVEKMEAKNPGWFKDADKAHLVEALAKVLNDPEIAARRKSWEETVAKGKALFSDASLGTSGKSCASCHTAEAMRRVADEYPKYDPTIARYLSFQEKISLMVSGKMGGKELSLGDHRPVELETYLKSLR